MKIRYLPSAENDLLDILDYVSRDNVDAAVTLIDDIDRTISLLAKQPEIGVVPKDPLLQRKGYRILIVKKYLVFYVLKADEIQIRRVIHGARRYRFLL